MFNHKSFFFFFKQKTAYEMRISDWSSDVCSSDLLSKLAGQYAEKARVAVRNVRRDGMDNLKQDENKKAISEDDRKRSETEVQKLTEATIADIDAAATAKEKEILG